MGNRAVIQMSKDGKYNKKNMGIFVQWNGGLDSVKYYLAATKELEKDSEGLQVMQAFEDRCARLVRAVTTFLPTYSSVGLDLSENLWEDNWDNGVYVIDMRTLEISERRYKPPHLEEGQQFVAENKLATKQLTA